MIFGFDFDLMEKMNRQVVGLGLFSALLILGAGCESTKRPEPEPEAPAVAAVSEKTAREAQLEPDVLITPEPEPEPEPQPVQAPEPESEPEPVVAKPRPILPPTQEAIDFLIDPPPPIDSQTPGLVSLNLSGVLKQSDLTLRFMVKKIPGASMVALVDEETNIPNFIAVNQTALIYNFFDNQVVLLRGVGFNFKIYENDGAVRFECGPKVDMKKDPADRTKQDSFDQVSIDLTDFYTAFPSGNIRFPDRRAGGYMVTTRDHEGHSVTSVVAQTLQGPRYVEALIQLQDTIQISEIQYNPNSQIQIPNLEFVRNDLENSGVNVRVIELKYLDEEDLALTMSRITWPIYYWKLLNSKNSNDRFFLERELQRQFDWEKLRQQYEITGTLLNLSILNALQELYPDEAK